MTAPTITPLPTPPSRQDDGAAFIDKADAFLGAFPQLQTEINTFGTYVDDTGSGFALSVAEVADLTAEANNSATAAASSATSASNSAAEAENAKDIAVAAFDASNVYETIALGRAAVLDGEFFWVRPGGSDALATPTLYRRDSASTQTLVYAQPTIGPGLTQVPTGQNTQDGLNRPSKFGGVVSLQDFFVDVGSEGFTKYILLASNNTPGAAYFSGHYTISSGNIGNGHLAQGGLVIHKVNNGNCNASFDYQGMGTSGAGYAPSLVTVDIDGVNYIALKFGTGTRNPAGMYFSGTVAGKSNLTFGVSAVSNGLNEVAYFSSGNKVSGRPGDAIGPNQALHIAGNPNTSRAVFVDANGFIKVV